MSWHDELYCFRFEKDAQFHAWKTWFGRNKKEKDVYWRFPIPSGGIDIVSTIYRNQFNAVNINASVKEMVNKWVDDRADGDRITRSFSVISERDSFIKFTKKIKKSENVRLKIKQKYNYDKEQWRVKAQNVRAEVKGVQSDLTIKQWLSILERFDYKCVYCGGDFEELEHIISISDGGGTTADNVIPSCKKCNRTKEFARKRVLKFVDYSTIAEV
jgi:5-methylcytosine-specific restriction endonuclease McrA